MAPSDTKRSLETLDGFVNDVLIQTGKALRASRRDGQGNLPAIQMHAKLPEIISAFHSALDDIENHIIHAKSVLLRDLDQLKAQNNPSEESQSSPQPQPAGPQSKLPIAIEIDSSPEPAPKEEPTDNGAMTIKSSAPIPDMGLHNSTAPVIPVKGEGQNVPSYAPITSGNDGYSTIKAEGIQLTSAAPVPAMDAKLESIQPGIGGGVEALDLTNSDSNFTNMEFSLAPGVDSQTQPGGQGVAVANPNEPSFDLGSFGATDGATSNMSLINSVPTNNVEQPVDPKAGTSEPIAEGQKKEEAPGEPLDDLFANDGEADGMDFDFGLDDGMGGDTFDDLMNDRDNTFDSMEHGDFDANFFGLDKIDDP
ncbi:hypothetical protein QQS21_008067 [Conoideocrella luteorostrata]|uniref:Uncharacterized protein n=1 Tax=Conoideocrella luteorostrata TaxID=1105319 RepID=A0AAJ0FYZ5_9HYPO|nr:hypothetical protein QQS21_008067 [Conoideocrella luteorostrata]